MVLLFWTNSHVQLIPIHPGTNEKFSHHPKLKDRTPLFHLAFCFLITMSLI